MRVGLEKSRNTMTVRLAQMIGIEKALEIGKRFGIYDAPPRNFSIVLGTAETTLLRLANAYGVIVNGGKRITPSLIERIDDRHGKTIYRRDSRDCPKCMVQEISKLEPDYQLPPIPEDTRERVLDPRVAYQMVSMLQGVATRGTAAKSKEIGRIVGGKTGTTNDSLDTWFVGFSPDLVAGVYVGYDKPRTLGKKETGASVALPAFISFMKDALANDPNKPFRVPPGIQLMHVDIHSGMMPGEQSDFTYDATGAAHARPEPKLIEESIISGEPIYIPGVSKEYKEPLKSLPEENSATENEISHLPSVIIEEPAAGEIQDMPASPQKPPVSGTGGLY
jgi:penicillin-binding protein 1A